MGYHGARGRILAAVLLGLTATGNGFPTAQAESGAMLTGGVTSQPIGHYKFCKRNPAECAIRSPGNAPEQMSEGLRKRIVEINLAVNESIRPMSDIDLFGKAEVWTYPGQAGDCEDYVLQKRRILSEEGIALSNLLITVVRKPDGEGHAVLTVRTDQGDLVLDNLRKTVLPWEETGYRYLKRQASDHTGRWVSILDGDEPLVGSVD